MFEFALENPYVLHGVAALAGVAAASFLLWTARSRRTWATVDLVWIIGGGLSLLATTVSTVQLNHLMDIRRRSDLFAAELATARDHSLAFAAVTCDPRSEPAPEPPELDAICAPVRTFLSDAAPDGLIATALSSFGTETLDASDALYVDPMIANLMVGDAAPSQPASRASARSRSGGTMSMAMLEAVRREVTFSPRPGREEMERAAQALIRSGFEPGAALEGKQIVLGYDAIERDFGRLKADWLALSRLNVLLLSRILAISFIALVFPLRVGKSWADLFSERS